jgi:hypothetical protein
MELHSHPKNSAELVAPPLITGCIYLSNPFPECYCMGVTSFKIFKILRYCNCDYKSCAIYSNKESL